MPTQPGWHQMTARRALQPQATKETRSLGHAVLSDAITCLPFRCAVTRFEVHCSGLRQLRLSQPPSGGRGQSSRTPARPSTCRPRPSPSSSGPTLLSHLSAGSLVSRAPLTFPETSNHVDCERPGSEAVDVTARCTGENRVCWRGDDRERLVNQRAVQLEEGRMVEVLMVKGQKERRHGGVGPDSEELGAWPECRDGKR